MHYIFMEAAVTLVLVFILYKVYTWIVYPAVDSWFRPAEPSHLREQIESAKAEAQLQRKQTELEINRKTEAMKQLEEIAGSRPDQHTSI